MTTLVSAQANLFDVVFVPLVNGSVNLADLRLALLDSSYVFSSTEASAETIIDTHAVANGAWEKVGLSVVLTKTEENGEITYTLEPESYDIILYPTDFQHVFLYNYTTDEPIAVFSYPSLQTIQDSTAVFSGAGSPIISVTME